MSIFYDTKSKTGIPCLGVGGGAYSDSTNGRVVFRNGVPAPAIFVRAHGNLACHTDQAVVPVKLGDVIVEIRGTLPVKASNPGLRIYGWAVTGIRDPRQEDRNSRDETVVFETEKATAPDIFAFESIVLGLTTYLNRDGTLFVTGWGQNQK